MYRDWMDSQPGLISSVVYTYLSLLPFHVSPTLANLKDQETQTCISLIRTRVSTLYICLRCIHIVLQYTEVEVTIRQCYMYM